VTSEPARLISADVLAEALDADSVSAELATAHKALATLGEVEVGLWSAGPGVDTDVEVDEVFLVLSGQGAVEFDDSSVIELRPGVLVRLHAGDQTTWQITERLTKLYLA